MVKARDAKKPARKGGKHKAPRLPVFLPAEWAQRLAELANARPMPANWLACELIAAAWEAAGRDRAELPPFPWHAAGDSTAGR